MRTIRTTILATCLSLLTVLGAANAHAAAGCPGGVFFETDPTGSLLDFGWSGIGHRRSAVGYSLRMDLSCGPSAPPCGTCSITGLSSNAGGNNQRCSNDTSIICTAATEVADCGGAGLCHFFAAPPNGVATGGVSTCWTSEIVGAVSGTADPDTGELSPNVPVQMKISLGASIDAPCPRCVGDATINDNVRGGTCDGGTRVGLACDANAFNADYPDFGSTSFDCPSNPGSSIGTLIVGNTGLTTGTQSSTLTSASPVCRAPGYAGYRCQCDTCNSAGQQPCATSADCPASGGGAGICGGKRCLGGPSNGAPCLQCIGGSNHGASCTVASQCPGGSCNSQCGTCLGGTNIGNSCAVNFDCPGKMCFGGTNNGASCTVFSQCPGGSCSNALCSGVCNIPGASSAVSGCVDDTDTPGLDCTDTVPIDGEGQCDNGPLDNNCTIASGHAQRGCTIDNDCGGALGSCDVTLRACFPDDGALGNSVSSSGTATPPVGNTSDPTDLAGVGCMGPTTSSAANSVLGLPGLARRKFVGRAVFAEEIVVEVVPPGGTATTNGSGPASVVETSVTSPNGGEISIIGTFNTGTPPSGYTFLGRLVQIEAPAASAASPLSISFDIDASEIPAGQNENTIQIFRNGVGPIPNCLGSTQAVPSPCITARTALGGGDVRITVLTVAASEWTMAVASGAPPSGPNKCTEGKEKCVSKGQACKLACHTKAESTGLPVDPLCMQKCQDKFDGGADPTKGCFAKLEAKYGGSCVTTGDTAALGGTVDAFTLNTVTQLDPIYPAPVQNGCSANKKKCVNKLTACKLGCYSKAHGKGLAVDPLCLGKCEDKFDGGANPAKGCFAKLEAIVGFVCLTAGDTPILAATVDAFVDDAVCQLNGPSGGTCP